MAHGFVLFQFDVVDVVVVLEGDTGGHTDNYFLTFIKLNGNLKSTPPTPALLDLLYCYFITNIAIKSFKIIS